MRWCGAACGQRRMRARADPLRCGRRLRGAPRLCPTSWRRWRCMIRRVKFRCSRCRRCRCCRRFHRCHAHTRTAPPPASRARPAALDAGVLARHGGLCFVALLRRLLQHRRPASAAACAPAHAAPLSWYAAAIVRACAQRSWVLIGSSQPWSALCIACATRCGAMICGWRRCRHASRPACSRCSPTTNSAGQQSARTQRGGMHALASCCYAARTCGRDAHALRGSLPGVTRCCNTMPCRADGSRCLCSRSYM